MPAGAAVAIRPQYPHTHARQQLFACTACGFPVDGDRHDCPVHPTEALQQLLHILCACFLFAAATLLLILFGVLDLPRSFPVLAGLYLVALLSASRFSYRLIRTILHRSGSEKRKKRTMLIGAGSAGMLVLREFQTSENSQNNVVCVIDDDRDKLGKYIRNVKIAGTRDDIVALAQSRRIEEIVLAIPTAAVRERRNILQLCQKTGCRLKILPGIYQLANGEVNIQKIRNVDVQDLLGRDCVKVDLSQIAGYLSGKTILVTGGGGSIGSELCRQIARHTPKRLVLLDIYENNAYAIEQELHRTHPELDLAVCIGSVRDEMRVSSLFAQYRPDIVFHAAAHKHVPLMEGSPNEAIKNNVFGTLHVAQAADRYGTETFVLISTDKAVNPTNVMGASKRHGGALQNKIRGRALRQCPRQQRQRHPAVPAADRGGRPRNRDAPGHHPLFYDDP